VRAFLAVHLDADLRRQLAAIQDELRGQLSRPGGPRARVTWVKPDALHLTIKFLGDIAEGAADPLRERIGAIVAGRLSFEIPLQRLGAFPRPQAPRTIWMGPVAGWDASPEGRSLVGFVRLIDEACGAIGVPGETHDWRPHLTLARLREGERDAGRVLTEGGFFERVWALPALGVVAISFMRSELLPGGPRHTEIWTVS